MKLAFLELLRADSATEDSSASPAVRGVALVTDGRTRPLEFRLTDPVRPTTLERKLCGAVFDEHVAGDLCCGPLLDALRERPDCILVREESLLCLQDRGGVPVLWIGRDESEEGQASAPLIGFNGDGEALRDAKARLAEIAQRYDLLEPFERMRAAVGEVLREGFATAV